MHHLSSLPREADPASRELVEKRLSGRGHSIMGCSASRGLHAVVATPQTSRDTDLREGCAWRAGGRRAWSGGPLLCARHHDALVLRPSVTRRGGERRRTPAAPPPPHPVLQAHAVECGDAAEYGDDVARVRPYAPEMSRPIDAPRPRWTTVAAVGGRPIAGAQSAGRFTIFTGVSRAVPGAAPARGSWAKVGGGEPSGHTPFSSSAPMVPCRGVSSEGPVTPSLLRPAPARGRSARNGRTREGSNQVA
jgi:hypothetical protein